MFEWLNTLSPAALDVFSDALNIAGVLLGATIGAGGTLIVTLINKRSDERKHTRELAIRWALEQWNLRFSAASAISNTLSVPHIMDYMMKALLVSDVMFDKNSTDEDIAKKMIEVNNRVQRIAAIRKESGFFEP